MAVADMGVADMGVADMGYNRSNVVSTLVRDMKPALFSVLLAAFLASALAFPNFWPGKVNPKSVCDSHPDAMQKSHAAPVTDKDIEFILKKGKTVSSDFCPGRKYTLTVKFSDPRKALLTSTAGSLGQNAADTIKDCPTRKNLSGDPLDGFKTTDTYKVKWTAPCDKSIEKVTMKVTSATGAIGGYMVNSVTIPQKKKCTTLKRCG